MSRVPHAGRRRRAAARVRALLVCAYVVVALFATLSALYDGPDELPNRVLWVVEGFPEYQSSRVASVFVELAGIVYRPTPWRGARADVGIGLAVFFASQILCVMGAGRVRLLRKPAVDLALRRAIFVLVALPMTGLVFGVGFAALVFALFSGLGTSEMTPSPDDLPAWVPSAPIWFGQHFVALVLVSWLVWCVVFAARLLLRRRSLRSTSSPLYDALLGATWIDFFVALAVDLSVRSRSYDSCHCHAGSWIGLAAACPVLIWAMGPAVLLVLLDWRIDRRRSPTATRVRLTLAEFSRPARTDGRDV